ncbi:MAG TPA: hypothetical protein VKV03_05650 [Candidatus Binataceae bacterium]|nr:hypothetical protein [Candidatus Binataceae bacterium]
MKYWVGAALTSVLVSGCLPIPHLEPSPHVVGRVVDGQTCAPVPDTEITMTGAFEGSARSGPDGKFEIPERQHLRLLVTLGDDGCDLTVVHAGYCEWHDQTLCGKVHVDWDVYDALLDPDNGSCASHTVTSALVCVPNSHHN